nr:MAG TPA: portal [Caudoviricetes sp.]DAW68607.1 MAG TPA: portal [Caudoviricetes sp.]
MKKNKNKIVQGGYISQPGLRQPDVVLQMPELFHFNLETYMNAVNAAKSIDYSNRVRLYDMYESTAFDLHLSGVMDKRLRGVTQIPIEFQRNGKPDKVINKQLRSPWFKELRKELILSEFWGFTLLQLYVEEDQNIHFESINRKHYDPIKRKLLRFQGDMDGVPIESFQNMLFIGSERKLGIFAEILPAVLYKKGNIGDWARFCNIFGMPIREYTYDAGDEEARRRLIQDARRQGSNAVYIHPKDSDLTLIEAGNKTGSSELYRTFAEYWDSKMSIRILGNTLTTDVGSSGTQALGTVHKDEEDEMNADDREFILDILNYQMKDLFNALGFNTDGGEFVYAKKDKIDVAQQIDIVQKCSNMGLPIDDDYLYDTFGIEKPKDYNAIKEQKNAEKEALKAALNSDKDEKEKGNSNDNKTSFKQRLNSFFGIAPTKGAKANTIDF